MKITIHVAGPFDKASQMQCCSRCGAVLKDNRHESQPAQIRGEHPFIAGPPYPIGALIESGPGFQSMVLGKPWGEPCVPPT